MRDYGGCQHACGEADASEDLGAPDEAGECFEARESASDAVDVEAQPPERNIDGVAAATASEEPSRESSPAGARGPFRRLRDR
jgi:hypothetical protein